MAGAAGSPYAPPPVVQSTPPRQGPAVAPSGVLSSLRGTPWRAEFSPSFLSGARRYALNAKGRGRCGTFAVSHWLPNGLRPTSQGSSHAGGMRIVPEELFDGLEGDQWSVLID